MQFLCTLVLQFTRNEIKNLDCGEMIIATNYMRFAAPVKVHKFEEFLTKRYGDEQVLLAKEAIAL